MRKVKLQMQLSIDGFVAGPNGEMDWMNWNWGDDIKAYLKKIMDGLDLILLGKNLAQGFIPHWDTAALEPEKPENEGAEFFSNTKKIVFSKSLKSSDWERTELNNGDLVEEINLLKNQPGGDIIVYGGGNFVSNLIKNNLIDEYHLFINPTIIGKGMTIFSEVSSNLNLILEDVQKFDCGITVLKYKKG